MQLNRIISTILNLLIESNLSKENLIKEQEKIKILSDKHELFSVSNNSLTLLKKTNLHNKILLKKSEKSNTLDEEKLMKIVKLLSNRIIRLNHVGVGYNCENPESEIKKYFKHLTQNFKIYEEISDNKFVKWYFVGNLKDIEAPLFEIVLTKDYNPEDKWSPHFQIDIDTNLSSNELLKIIDDFDWQLNMPNGEVVLGMKIFGEIDGTKVILGISTKNRDFLYHRKKLLEEIKN
jgi:hypothetical protein